VYSVNVGEFMSWLNIYLLRFKLRAGASDNEIRTNLYLTRCNHYNRK